MPVSSDLSWKGPKALVPQKFLEQAVESPLNAIFVYDLREETMVFMNRRFCEITGYSLGEMKSLTKEKYLSLIHPLDRYKIISHWGTLSQSEDSVEHQIDYRFRAKSGAWIWCQSRDTIFERDKESYVSRYISVFLDITESKQIESQLREQKDILDKASIVVETDLKGRIIYANDKFCEVSQYSRDELIGRTHHVVNSGYHSKEFFRELWATIKAGETWEGEIKNKAKDGTYFWLHTTIKPFKDWDGKVFKYVAVRHEVTKEKEYEYKLQQQIEIAQRALSSAEIKGRFISEMSHEVRNNLGFILGYSDLLIDGIKDDKNEFLTRIKKASEHTLELMNNVLDAIRLETSTTKLDESPTSLREIIANAIDISKGNIDKKGLHLRLELAEDLPKVILVDSHRLTQVFLNLLSNATKYTEKGEIVLSTKNLGMTPDGRAIRLQFTVSDTGRGIPKEKLATLFREFEQCSPKDAGQGTGLGLAICKRIVDLMGGKIWAESSGQNSKFSFEITTGVTS